uniref:PAS domain-containing protein n=1 Tax=Rhodoferax sp. GW822-FHT02A01 TaxID=3141537 RepID=UPI00406D429F
MNNQSPVTQNEYELPDDALLVSTTDLKGHITRCNYGFVVASGYDYEELLGQPHDMVRHPDMPPEAFKDLWPTVGRGRPWTGIVKNRRKNGDHLSSRTDVQAPGVEPRPHQRKRSPARWLSALHATGRPPTALRLLALAELVVVLFLE